MSTELVKGRSTTWAPAPARVLVVAGTGHVEGLAVALRERGHEVIECDSVEAGCAALADQHHDLIFVDTASAETIVATAQDLSVPVITIGERPVAAAAGYLPAAVAAGAAAIVTDLLLEREVLSKAKEQLEGLVEGVRDGSVLVGRSPVMRRLQSTLSRAADSDATVLVEGAPGAGKSVAARVIHCKSRRGNRPLVVRNAGDLDSETMAQAFAEAKGTSLVIEDIEQLPLVGQQALVRIIKERSNPAVADGAPARLIATTSAHLPELVARGAFREDLYYRLHAYPIVVPSLRERIEDVSLLAEALLDQIASTHSQRPVGFTPAGRIMLESMPWPGNVAQLETIVRRAFLAAGGAPIDERHLLQPATAAAAAQITASPSVVDEAQELTEDAIRPFDEEEQRLLSRALRATRGNVRRAAQLLGIGRATLYRKIQQYKLRLQ